MDSRVHNLAPGELFEVPIDIKAPSVLKFSFSVLEGGSVEFSVVHKAGGKKSKETTLLPASTYSENIGEVPASACQSPCACVRVPALAPRSKAPCLPLVCRSCCRARACASCASTTQPAGSTRPKSRSATRSPLARHSLQTQRGPKSRRRRRRRRRSLLPWRWRRRPCRQRRRRRLQRRSPQPPRRRRRRCRRRWVPLSRASWRVGPRSTR